MENTTVNTDETEFKSKEIMNQLRASRTKVSDEWHSNVKKKILNFIVFLFAPPCLLIFILGSYDFFWNIEENKCQMTYMWEYPQYVKIPMDPTISHKFPMYGLYAYAEGKHIETARNSKFTGIPVLYLPGNAGSYKQVRSFASVALRKWLDNRTPFHFDFFSVDFNDEHSGMYGYVLERESQYVKAVITKITSMYEEYHHIVIIGHSMGGVIAKSVNEESARVQLIYTMATPHLHPPLITDPEQELFYFYVTRNWTEVNKVEDPVTLVSIAGGERDFLVSSRLTSWKYNTIHTSTPAIPTVWASTDHLCIVWCKQLVMTVVRSLFDLVEYKEKTKYYGVTENGTVRATVLNYHFNKRTSGKSFHSLHPPEVKGEKPPKGNWTEILSHSLCQSSFSSPTHVMIPRVSLKEKMLTGFPEDHDILISTTNTNSKNWIFGCKSLEIERGVKYCTTMENLSNGTVLLPSFHRNRKIIHLNPDVVSKFSHLVVKMDPVTFKTCLDVEVYKLADRNQYLGTAIKDSNHAMFYNFTFPVTFNQSILFAWNVHVDLVKDESGQRTQCSGHHNSIGLFKHGNFQTHNFFKNESLRVRFADTSTTSGHVLLYLERGCRYSIRVNLDYVGTAGQFFRLCMKLIPSYFASILLMSLFFQQSKDWVNFHWILLGNAYHLAILPGFIVALSIIFLPTDYRYMLTEADYSALLPMTCYLIAYALVLIVSLSFWVLTLTFGNGLHTIVTKFLGKKLGSVPDKVTDLALTLAMEKFPVTIAILVIAIGMSTSGALGLVIGLILYVLKIFKGYENILEDLIHGRIQSLGEGLSPINFHTHCALLWLVVAALNVPSLVYWVNSFRFGEIPNWDLSLYICLMLTPSIAVLWQGFVPNFNETMWSMQRYLCYFMGIIVVVYGTYRIYLISFIIVLVLVTLAICQFISRLADGVLEPAAESGNPPEPPHNPPGSPKGAKVTTKISNRNSGSNEREELKKKEDLKEDSLGSSQELASTSSSNSEDENELEVKL